MEPNMTIKNNPNNQLPNRQPLSEKLGSRLPVRGLIYVQQCETCGHEIQTMNPLSKAIHLRKDHQECGTFKLFGVLDSCNCNRQDCLLCYRKMKILKQSGKKITIQF